MYACSMGKLLQAAVHTSFQQCALSSGFFFMPAKGIKFYDVPLGNVKEELRFRSELELFNARDANSICLKCPGTSRGRLQLT